MPEGVPSPEDLYSEASSDEIALPVESPRLDLSRRGTRRQRRRESLISDHEKRLRDLETRDQLTDLSGRSDLASPYSDGISFPL